MICLLSKHICVMYIMLMMTSHTQCCNCQKMAQPRRRAHSYGIIVRNKSSVFIDCLDMTVNEGDSVTCLCRTNSLADSVVTWEWSKEEEHNTPVKYSTDILALKNVSRHQSGTYTCFGQKLDSKSSFRLKVVPKDERVRITYFKAFQEVNVADAKRVLICKAEGIPEPKYTILHRGIAVNYENEHAVDDQNSSALGVFECMAKNRVSSDRRSLVLNASLPVESYLKLTKDKIETTPNNTKDKIKSTPKNAKDEMVWKIGLISGACSFLFGILLVFFLVWSCRKFCGNDAKSKRDEVLARRVQEPTCGSGKMQLRHASRRPVNEEITLGVVHQSDGYELPFGTDSGNRRNRECCDENSYQALSEFRERDEDRYQTLNPVPW